jgi:hypothetical protein
METAKASIASPMAMIIIVIRTITLFPRDSVASAVGVQRGIVIESDGKSNRKVRCVQAVAVTG